MDYSAAALGAPVVFSSVDVPVPVPAVTLVVYFCTPWRLRNLGLIMASVFFYAWGAGDFVLIMLASTLADWALARLIEVDKRDGNLRSARLLLFGSIGRTSRSSATTSTRVLRGRGHERRWRTSGSGRRRSSRSRCRSAISFFTFHEISYIVDVYRGDVAARRNPLDFGHRTWRCSRSSSPGRSSATTRSTTSSSARRARAGRLRRGLAALRARPGQEGARSPTPWRRSPTRRSPCRRHELTTTAAWLGALAYTLQIYFDFSGYSDMAIGLGRMLGLPLAGELQPARTRRSRSPTSGGAGT